MRVKEYDPFANEFEVDTQGLDFCPVTKDWFSPPPVNLNDDLRKGYLKILDKNEVLWFNTNTYKARRQMLDQNIVGRGLEIKFEGKRRFTNVKIRSYNTRTRTHEVAVEGSASGGGAPPNSHRDLNELALRGAHSIKSSRYLADGRFKVACHCAGHQGGAQREQLRLPSRVADAERWQARDYLTD